MTRGGRETDGISPTMIIRRLTLWLDDSCGCEVRLGEVRFDG